MDDRYVRTPRYVQLLSKWIRSSVIFAQLLLTIYEVLGMYARLLYYCRFSSLTAGVPLKML